MAVNVTPLHDRVLVKRIEEKESIKGGIIIPDTAKEKPQEGEVIAVGAGKIEKGERIPLDVKAGDRILFGKYSGSEIKVDDARNIGLRREVAACARREAARMDRTLCRHTERRTVRARIFKAQSQARRADTGA